MSEEGMITAIKKSLDTSERIRILDHLEASLKEKIDSHDENLHFVPKTAVHETVYELIMPFVDQAKDVISKSNTVTRSNEEFRHLVTQLQTE